MFKFDCESQKPSFGNLTIALSVAQQLVGFNHMVSLKGC